MFKLYFDGASRSNPGPASYGGVIYLQKKNSKKEYYIYKKFIGIKTNNVAEYKGAYKGLKIAKELGITNIEVYGDSKLVIEQIKGNWKVKSENLKPTFNKIKNLLNSGYFENISFHHVYRKNNKRADELANEALDEY